MARSFIGLRRRLQGKALVFVDPNYPLPAGRLDLTFVSNLRKFAREWDPINLLNTTLATSSPVTRAPIAVAWPLIKGRPQSLESNWLASFGSSQAPLTGAPVERRSGVRGRVEQDAGASLALVAPPTQPQVRAPLNVTKLAARSRRFEVDSNTLVLAAPQTLPFRNDFELVWRSLTRKSADSTPGCFASFVVPFKGLDEAPQRRLFGRPASNDAFSLGQFPALVVPVVRAPISAGERRQVKQRSQETFNLLLNTLGSVIQAPFSVLDPGRVLRCWLRVPEEFINTLTSLQAFVQIKPVGGSDFSLRVASQPRPAFYIQDANIPLTTYVAPLVEPNIFRPVMRPRRR